MDSLKSLYFGWIAYDFLCLFFFLIIGCHLRIRKKQLLFVFACFAITIAVLGNAITMDYRAYWKIIQQVVYGTHRYIHLESIYIKLIGQIGANYILWQAFIYIPSYILFLLILKKLKISNIELFLFVFIVVFMYYDCIGSRQFLFIIIYYLGFIQLINKKWIYAFIILSFSCFFHKMAYMAIPLIPVYFIKIKGNPFKYVIFILLISFVLRYFLSPLLDMLSIASFGTGGEQYFSQDSTENSQVGSIWWNIIGVYCGYFRLFLLWYILYSLKELFHSPDRKLRLVYALVFYTACVALLFQIIGIKTIPYRVQSIGAIGLCYLISLLPLYKKISNYKKVSFFLGITIYWVLTNAYIKGVSNSVMLGDLMLE